MKRSYVYVVIFIFLVLVSCKDADRFVEPDYVLKKWARSIEKLNYKDYCKCEAYPKSLSVFRKMYKDYYIVDIMTIDIEDVKEEDVRKDHEKNPYLHRSLSFEGTLVKRKTKKSFQIIRGNAVFIRFLDGKQKKDGWKISNRTMVRINR